MIDLTKAITTEKEFESFSSELQNQSKLGVGRRPLVISGLCEGAEFAFINNLSPLAKKLNYDGVLLVVSDEKKANRLAEWLREYEKRVHVFIGREFVFYNAAASHEFEHERLFVLLEILKKQYDFIITTPDALLQYTVPRETLGKRVFNVSIHHPFPPEQLIDFLENAGYNRTEMVESVGQYSVRGGIIDIYSPSNPSPVRIDFFGDEIDRMCYFDIMTQRRIEDCNDTLIVPAREVIADKEAEERVIAKIKIYLRNAKNPDVKEKLQGELQALLDHRETAFLDKYLPYIYPEKECLLDYMTDALTVVLEYGACLSRLEGQTELDREQLKLLMAEGVVLDKNAEYSAPVSSFDERVFDDSSVLISNMGSRLSGHRFAEMYNFRSTQTTGYGDRFDLLLEDLRGYMAGNMKVKMICENEASLDNLVKMLNDSGFGAYKDHEKIEQRPASVALTFGQNISGFELPLSHYVCITECNSAFAVRSANRKRKERKKDKNLQKILSYADLSEGDFVVHDIHGIGQYLGMSSLTLEGVRKDFIKIKYAGKDMLYLPCDQLDKISKYIGSGAEDGNLKLSKMGGTDWKKAKFKAKASAQNMAKQLITLYAERMRKDGIAYPRDDDMQREFESAFEYEETDCQLSAAEDVKRDMERRCPMDRLLCGDVGYGKTEVALRAAFKAVSGGYQVAILVPTTILCMQHYKTILSRMRGFPVSADMVCRFRTKKEIDESIRKLRRGETDIIVGTHRLLSKDVEFKKLGLLIVDEEQRFGVTHKEKLKELSKNVDVLTLSATPIPRTLNMAMSGIRDMSILDEAPVDRLPVQTFVLEHDEQILNEAIRREIRRGGQVFYLCNRVEQMPYVADRLGKAFPDLHIEIANGQMDKDTLSDIWEEMVTGEIDILVSTTIIETGVDVPNANTLIIENADKLGLSQLHQIRGRVGRSSRRAFAYFTYPKGKELTEISEKRLSAIRDFTEFGSGFRIAMRDMEIRGVGNLLGAEQHGNMEVIGYDLYMKLLNDAVLEEKGIKEEKKTECTVEMNVNAYIPETYIQNPNQRIDAYKKISLIETAEDLRDVCDEMLDRYGEPPRPLMNILTISYLRALGSKAKFTKISSKGTSVLFYPEEFAPAKMAKLASLFNGKLLITLAGTPYATLRVGSSSPSAQAKAASELLEKYISLEEDT